uniref:Reverse transcriptase domain-containing protein n=1 Tax=Oryzias latipes TaxID=8090 RepID=A0A3P9KDL8_ORYLA
MESEGDSGACGNWSTRGSNPQAGGVATTDTWKDLRPCINLKKLAFNNNDKIGLKTAQKDLDIAIKKARNKHRLDIENSFNAKNTKHLWDTMKKVTNMNSVKTQPTTMNSADKANELNKFFLRFDSHNAGHMADIDILNPGECSPCTELLNCDLVINTFRKVPNKKSAGPDGLTSFLYRNCSEELSEAWAPVFQKSIQSCEVPALWKNSVIIPIPKISSPQSGNDFRPIALTCIAMKCFEKIMIECLKEEVSPFLDNLQFAYKHGSSTADAVISASHLILKHLEAPNSYARVLFADFSSAFDTVQPAILVKKMLEMNVNPDMVKWFFSLLTDRTQQVKLNGTFSKRLSCNTGIPQGAVSSPLLFTLYTNSCQSSHTQNKIIKFSDDTIIISLLSVADNPSIYFDEVKHFNKWCEDHSLLLNTTKTKEIIFDPKGVTSHRPLAIGSSQIEAVNSIKYLGVWIDNQMKWTVHVDYLCGKLAQRLYFLRRLRLFGVSSKILITFYNAVLESLARYAMTARFGALSVKDKNKLCKQLNVALKICGCRDHRTLQVTYEETT